MKKKQIKKGGTWPDDTIKSSFLDTTLSPTTKSRIDTFITTRSAKKIQTFTLPFIRRVSANINDRIKYASLLDKYLKDIDKIHCLVSSEDDSIKFSIANRKIELIKSIGTESKYGAIYYSKGINEGALFKFCTKIMENDKYNILEIEILEKLKDLVIKNKNPHFPIMYKNFECNKSSDNKKLPEVVKNKKYFINLNELANGDLNMFMKTSHARRAKYTNNALAQVLLSIFSLHCNNYYHKDSHYGNFLFHRITPGGYIKYNINGNTIYLENIGYLWVIWDFGFSEKIKNYEKEYTFFEDYFKILRFFLNNYNSLFVVVDDKPKDDKSEDDLDEVDNKQEIYNGQISNYYTIHKETQQHVEKIFDIYKHIKNIKKNNHIAGECLLFKLLSMHTNLFIKESDLPRDAKIINSNAYKIL